MKPLYALPSFFFKIHFNITYLCTHRYSSGLCLLILPPLSCVCISPVTQTCRMSRPSHSSFGLSTNIVRCVQITVIIMQFSPLSCYRKLGPNIFLSTLFLHILSLCSFFNTRDHVSHPYKLTTLSLPQNVTSNVRMVTGE